MSFLPRHENCIVPIESGEMKIKAADDSVIEAFIGDGFIEFLDNEAEVVCVNRFIFSISEFFAKSLILL